MAYENVGSNLPGITASGDLSSNQFRAVVINANGQAAVAGADVAVDGFLQNKPDAAGKACTIWGPGSVTKAVVGTGGATRGALATTAADGVKDAASTDIVCGRFLETGAAGATVALWMGPQCGGAAP